MPARSQLTDQAVNPFKSRTDAPTFPQSIWDILKDYPEGLSIACIVRELQERGLKDLSGLKKPNGQVRPFTPTDGSVRATTPST